jgi:hypothetical protein
VSKSLVLKMIYNEIQDECVCYSVIADETRDKGCVEQLSVCLRYVHKSEIRERFVGFIDLHKFDAQSITENILQILKDLGINVSNCVAQAYDGASVMSGRYIWCPH